jgi:DNA-directed RNA polymerase subunit RPC12/RpoP
MQSFQLFNSSYHEYDKKDINFIVRTVTLNTPSCLLKSEKMKYRCLRCLKEWEARIEKPSQCPWCGSYHILDEETFERMVQTTEEFIVRGLPARFPEIDALRAVIRQFGLLQVLKADETCY